MKKSESEEIAVIEGILFDEIFGGKKNPFSFDEIMCSECLAYQDERPKNCTVVHTCPSCGFTI